MTTPTSLDRTKVLAETNGWSTQMLDGRLAVTDGYAETSILRCTRGGRPTVVAVWKWEDDGKASFEAGIVVSPARLLKFAEVKAYLKGEQLRTDGQPCGNGAHSPRVVKGVWTCPDCAF